MVKEASSIPKGTPTPRPVCTLADALWQEFTAIHGDEAPALTEHAPNEKWDAYVSAAKHKEPAALCLSGGGVRSAAFSLGVIQALARKDLLAQFHYLSTVSGGGYIGGWLTALVHEHHGDVGAVQERLKESKPTPELRALRQFTNFLTPQPGAASPDTWAGIILWVRNVLVNWMLFLPAMFAFAVAPVFYRDLIDQVSPVWGMALLLVGLICLGLGVYFGAAHLPSHAPPSDRAHPDVVVRPTSFAVRWVVVPILTWAFLAPLIAAPSLRLVMPEGTPSAALIPIGSFVAMVLAYIFASIRGSSDDRKMFRSNFIWWVIATFLASVLLDVGLTLGLNQTPAVIAALGPLWVTVAHLCQSLFYVALRREGLRADLDREWLARLSAVKVMPALLWAVFAAVCLLLPPLILDGWSTQFKPWILGVIGVLTGPGVAWLGKSTLSTIGRGGPDAAQGPRLSINLIVAIGTALFAVLLFMLLGWAANALTDAFAPRTLRGTLPSYRWAVDLAFLVVTFGVAYKLGERINVNRFSMHAVYRNRLVRAFLGSARNKRNPDTFTGIDPDDNPRMSDLFERTAMPRTLFPVINLTLNLTVGESNAWTERKAASFTVTPLSSGAANLCRLEEANAGRLAHGAYVTTADYAGNERETGPGDKGNGLTLGTAITLSGAAVSPNMGYHSNAAAAFLMTLFNVRLGAWLPNPATAAADELQDAKPPNALFTLLREMLGQSDGIKPAIYLSDGGHFENLGLYEMIRRRCRYILAVDAGEDADAEFTDLGNAARKVFIDFGVRITFHPAMAIGSRAEPIDPIRGYAYGRITYPDGGPDGHLIYIKPCDLPDVQIDVRAYRNANDTFPHQSTLNQWFSESEFESYRGLGETEMAVLGPPPGGPDSKPSTIAELFSTVHDQLTQDGEIECDLETETGAVTV